MNLAQRLRTLLIADAFLVLLMLLGIVAVSQRSGSAALLERIAHELSRTTVRIDSVEIHSVEQAEFVLYGYSIGSSCTLSIGGTPGHNEIVLLPTYYSARYLAIAAAASLIFVFLGIFVFLRRPDDLSAGVFHKLCMSIALLISLNPGYRYSITPWLSTFLILVFCLCYALVPYYLLQFSVVFPDARRRLSSWTQRALWILHVLVAALMMVSLVLSLNGTTNTFEPFEIAFQICRILFILDVALSLFFILRSYAASQAQEERRKIRWVLLGYAVSVSSYSVLWLIPQLLFHTAWVGEEFVTLLIVVAPLTFAIAIVRYRVLDIDVIVNRGVVYAIVLSFLLLVYAGLMTLAVSMLGSDFNSLKWILPCIILLNVLLFAPARGVVQRWVDRRFFRVEYNYRNTQRLVLERLALCLNAQQLAQQALHEVDQLFHPERCVIAVRDDSMQLRVLASIGYDASIVSHDELYNEKLFAAVYTMIADNADSGGVLCCGAKKSGQRYRDEDIDLLVSIASQCAAMLQRFRLQEDVLRENLESRRLSELNELKSYFVSGVTHELKTPLTSIRMFAEMLHAQVQSEKAHNYLRIIEGESDRLTRLINNVLSFAMIERGVKEYHPEVLDVQDVVHEVIDILRYQIELSGFELSVELNASNANAVLDHDALVEVLINLLSNAMKYSADRKQLALACEQEKAGLILSVRDQGIGMSEEDLLRIFDPFVRLGASTSNRVGGAGLGLALVKHFADAHRILIEVESTVDEGSCFRLHIPQD